MVSKLIHLVSQCFYPAYCYQCYEIIPVEEVFCGKCYASIKPVVSLYVAITPKKIIKIIAGGAYQEPLKQLVIKKFRSEMLASKHLAQIIIMQIPEEAVQSVDLFVPIPLHWMRYAQRGYNQAHVMANTLAEHYNKGMISALRRIKRTRFQSMLTKTERQENIQDAFACKSWYRHVIEGKHIGLVDDLYTSGATVANAAKKLFEAGAKEITVFVGCRKID